MFTITITKHPLYLYFICLFLAPGDIEGKEDANSYCEKSLSKDSSVHEDNDSVPDIDISATKIDIEKESVDASIERLGLITTDTAVFMSSADTDLIESAAVAKPFDFTGTDGNRMPETISSSKLDGISGSEREIMAKEVSNGSEKGQGHVPRSLGRKQISLKGQSLGVDKSKCSDGRVDELDTDVFDPLFNPPPEPPKEPWKTALMLIVPLRLGKEKTDPETFHVCTVRLEKEVMTYDLLIY